ncbi:MAG: YceI family protein [Acidimicrobiia bacterium]
MTVTRYELVPERSQVWIEGSSSVHPVHATTTGLAGWIEVDLTATGLAAKSDASGHVEIPVQQLRSGNPLVDRETRRRVDAKKYPLISGDVTGVDGVDRGVLHLRGVIHFRGESCDVEGDLTVGRDGDGLILEGEQTFDVRDWGLQPPKLLMLTVHPDVTVRIRCEARPSR